MLSTVPSAWRILKKTKLYSGFKNNKPNSTLVLKNKQKSANSSLFMNSILQNGKIKVENSRLEFMPRNLDFKCRSRIHLRLLSVIPPPGNDISRKLPLALSEIHKTQDSEIDLKKCLSPTLFPRNSQSILAYLTRGGGEGGSYTFQKSKHSALYRQTFIVE
jgi:hypothetical protein